MNPESSLDRKLIIRLATEAERESIYRLRHDIYARELGQHATNADGKLTDALDAHNVYIVALHEGAIAGFISVTPPTSPRFSIDKYFSRASLPLSFDARLYEVRILSVVEKHRGNELSIALMYAALRWVESRGGTRIVALGRSEVLGLYRKVGLKPLGRQAKAGEVTYELVGESTAEIHQYLCRIDRLLSAIHTQMDWRLDMPFYPQTKCFHGGAFFDAVGVQFDCLDNRAEVINADVLDAWFPPSDKVVAALQEYLPWLARTSPPINSEGLATVIARVRGVEPVCILPGAGSSDLIYLALRSWLTASSRALILDPTYGEYAYVLEKVIGCRVDRVPLSRENGYRLDPDSLDAHLQTHYDLVVLVNPNSPTGQFVPGAALEAVLSRAPRTTRFWIDETYIEYAGSAQSLESFAAAHPNVVVCKSMSKMYALSGLRAAYLCGAPERIEELRLLSPPWAVGLLAQVAAVKALEDPLYYAARYEETRRLGAQLVEALRGIAGLAVYPGVANFVLCHLTPEGPDAETVVQRCRAHGLFIRNAGSMGSCLGTHALRVAVKDEESNRRMIKILKLVLGT